MSPEKKEFKSPWFTELLEKQVVLKSRYDAPLKSNPRMYNCVQCEPKQSFALLWHSCPFLRELWFKIGMESESEDPYFGFLKDNEACGDCKHRKRLDGVFQISNDCDSTT